MSNNDLEKFICSMRKYADEVNGMSRLSTVIDYALRDIELKVEGDSIVPLWVPKSGDIFKKKGTDGPLYHLCNEREEMPGMFGFVQELEGGGVAGGEISKWSLTEDYELVERLPSLDEFLDKNLKEPFLTALKVKDVDPEIQKITDEHFNEMLDDEPKEELTEFEEMFLAILFSWCSGDDKVYNECNRQALKDAKTLLDIARKQLKDDKRFKRGDVVRYDSDNEAYSGIYLIGSNNIGFDNAAYLFSIDLDNCTLATDEERKQYMDELALNGLYWDDDDKIFRGVAKINSDANAQIEGVDRIVDLHKEAIRHYDKLIAEQRFTRGKSQLVEDILSGKIDADKLIKDYIVEHLKIY